MYGSSKPFAKETAISAGHKKDQTRAPSSSEEDALLRIVFGDIAKNNSNNAESNSAAQSSNQRRKASVWNDITRCVAHLRQKGIITPPNFDQTLAEERAVFFSSSPRTVPLSTIDAILEACEIWRDFVTPKSYHALVCEQVKSMFRLEASAICYTNSGAELQAYVGNFATLVKKPPLGMSCSVNYHGKVSVYGV